MDELINLESFTSDNLYLSDQETLSWFESSTLFINYRTTRDWD